MKLEYDVTHFKLNQFLSSTDVKYQLLEGITKEVDECDSIEELRFFGGALICQFDVPADMFLLEEYGLYFRTSLLGDEEMFDSDMKSEIDEAKQLAKKHSWILDENLSSSIEMDGAYFAIKLLLVGEKLIFETGYLAPDDDSDDASSHFVPGGIQGMPEVENYFVGLIRQFEKKI